MHARAFSLYWDNIDPAIPAAQKSVFDHFQIPIFQHKIHGLLHGEWMDWVLTRMEDVDVFLFIDIDCIPLSKARVMESIGLAASGALVGAEGAANHVRPLRSYAGAWYVFINRKAWNAMARPSARPTPHTDAAQMWTDVWRFHKAPVELIAPTSCVTPKWDLPDRPKAYGIATTYGDHCFHLFESRSGDPKAFLERCGELTGLN